MERAQKSAEKKDRQKLKISKIRQMTMEKSLNYIFILCNKTNDFKSFKFENWKNEKGAKFDTNRRKASFQKIRQMTMKSLFTF